MRLRHNVQRKTTADFASSVARREHTHWLIHGSLVLASRENFRELRSLVESELARPHEQGKRANRRKMLRSDKMANDECARVNGIGAHSRLRCTLVGHGEHCKVWGS